MSLRAEDRAWGAGDCVVWPLLCWLLKDFTERAWRLDNSGTGQGSLHSAGETWGKDSTSKAGLRLKVQHRRGWSVCCRSRDLSERTEKVKPVLTNKPCLT